MNLEGKTLGQKQRPPTAPAGTLRSRDSRHSRASSTEGAATERQLHQICAAPLPLSSRVQRTGSVGDADRASDDNARKLTGLASRPHSNTSTILLTNMPHKNVHPHQRARPFTARVVGLMKERPLTALAPAAAKRQRPSTTKGALPGTQVLATQPFVPVSTSIPNAHLNNQSIDTGAGGGGGGGGGAKSAFSKLESQLADLHFQEDTRVEREGREREYALQRQRTETLRSSLEACSSGFTKYAPRLGDTICGGKEVATEVAMSVDDACRMLGDIGVLGVGEGMLSREQIVGMMAAASPARGRQGGDRLSPKEFRKWIAMVCDFLHVPAEPMVQLALKAERNSCNADSSPVTGPRLRPTESRKDPAAGTISKIQSEHMSHMNSAESISDQRPHKTAAQHFAQVRTALRLGVISSQVAASAAARQAQPPAPLPPNPLLTPAPYPGTYLTPMSLKWAHPPTHKGTHQPFTVSDNYPQFRKYLRDFEKLQPDKDSVRQYSARMHGPSHPRVRKPGFKACTSSAAPGYYRQAGGLGRVVCTICDRIFLDTTVLALHYKGQAHIDALARSRLPPPSSPSWHSEIDILASGHTTPSLGGERDESFDALDDLPIRGRNAIVDFRRPNKNMLFWWQKVKTKLALSLSEAADEELDDMVLSILNVQLPPGSSSDSEDNSEEALAPRRRVQRRQGTEGWGGRGGGGNGFRSRPEIPGAIRDALMIYFSKCVELRTAPNERVFAHMRAQFLCDAPPSPVDEAVGDRNGRRQTQCRTKSERLRCLDEKSVSGGRGSGLVRQRGCVAAGTDREDEVYEGESERDSGSGSLADSDADGEEGDDGDESHSSHSEHAGIHKHKHAYARNKVSAPAVKRGFAGGVERERRTLQLPGCLFPRLPSVAALSALLACAHWLRELDVSSNDLRGEGTAILCSALRASHNALETLKLCKSLGFFGFWFVFACDNALRHPSLRKL